jgi:hypothetical protein
MTVTIGRRELLAALGGAAAAWPLAARAQQTGKLPTIGFLGSTTPAAQSQLTAVFVQRLRELGWIEGQTVTIEYRWAEGRSERFAEFAAEFVRLKVDVILTHNTPPVLAAKQATSVIPIVFATAADPVGTGVVASLAAPVATSPGCRVKPLMLPANGSNFYARSSPVFAGWRSWPIPTIPMSPLSYMRLRQQHVCLVSKLICLKSDEPRISRRPSKRLRAVRKRSMSCPIRSCSFIGFASTLWRSAPGCRRCIAFGSTSKQAVSYPMDQAGRTSGDARPTTSTRFCEARNRLIYRCNSRPSSISSSI